MRIQMDCDFTKRTIIKVERAGLGETVYLDEAEYAALSAYIKELENKLKNLGEGETGTGYALLSDVAKQDKQLIFELYATLKLAYDIIIDREDLTEDELDTRMIIRQQINEFKKLLKQE